MSNELKVGENRKFSFSTKEYKIREILDKPEINMEWTYDSGVCPHCKKRLTRSVIHDFYKIEILGDVDKLDDDLIEKDIQLLGFTLDNRTMILTLEKYNEVFNKSKKFKKLKKVV